ncbi:hypothetical protein AB1K70_08095 [Bremerella sp. JC770]|uniref:hypothetical protein n=1 Tax=Bremerella sp. JC770 TaxID=3232137 RepID=UPI003457F7BB
MDLSLLKDMTGGWLVGDFSPNLIHSKDIEVAVKTYPAGQVEPKHHHKIAEEITVIASGKARMCDKILTAGDIIRLEPGESTAFEAIEPTITVVIKRPSVPDDKYLD